jgi:hypothetical protein
VGTGRPVPIDHVEVFDGDALPYPDRDGIIKEAKELSAKLLADFEKCEAEKGKPPPDTDNPDRSN